MGVAQWKPLQQTFHVKPPKEEIIQAHMEELNLPRDQVLVFLAERAGEYWINDLYQVQVTRHGPEHHGLVQLNIRRRDGKPIFRDWRHFQQIKNELLGNECEAVEIYPAESRLTDTSNKYHLWGYPDPRFRFPMGFQERDVRDDDGTKVPGLRQRKM